MIIDSVLKSIGVPLAMLSIGIALSKWFGWADQPPLSLTDKQLPPGPEDRRAPSPSRLFHPDGSPG